MSPVRAIVRNELRILRHDPVPLVLLIGMPIVLMALLSQSLGHVLLFEGYDDTPGSMHTTPGMACLFGFSIAIVGLALFREHGWRTWPRLRATGIGGGALLAGDRHRRRRLLAGKLVVPALRLGGLGGALVPVRRAAEMGSAARPGVAGELGDGGLPRYDPRRRRRGRRHPAAGGDGRARRPPRRIRALAAAAGRAQAHLG